jgi:hypothetical protein
MISMRLSRRTAVAGAVRSTVLKYSPISPLFVAFGGTGQSPAFALPIGTEAILAHNQQRNATRMPLMSTECTCFARTHYFLLAEVLPTFIRIVTEA